jgi:hypothetical protein
MRRRRLAQALPLPPLRFQLVLLPVAGGAGLMTYVVAGISLPAAMGTLALIGASVWHAAWRTMPATGRAELKARTLRGARAGVLATAAYDATRYGIVALASLSFQPFHVLPIFGRLFVGSHASLGVAYAVGIAYHVANGVGFAIAYALVVRRGGLWSGIVWGIALELTMALLYPSWLRIIALREFLAVSAMGHLVYGAVVGVTVRQASRKALAAVRA